MKKIIVVITGVPGVGKTRMAKEIAESLNKIEYISANDVIAREKLFSGYDKDGARLVRLGALKKSIESKIRKSKKQIILIDGHIMCDIRVRNATAIVLRQHLDVLKKRLEKRKYSRAKIRDNLVSEAIDYCGINAMKNYDSVYEMISDKAAKGKILALVRGGRMRQNWIDMLGELQPLLDNDNSYFR